MPIGNCVPDGGLADAITPGQLSVAENSKLITAPYRPESLKTSIVVGQTTIGLEVSFTVKVNWQVSALPAASETITCTGVVPIPNKEPDGCVTVTVGLGQLSVAKMSKSTTAPHTPGSLPTTMSDGQLTTGTSVSLTVTSKLQMSPLPDASAATQVMGVMPIGKNVPEAGQQ